LQGFQKKKKKKKKKKKNQFNFKFTIYFHPMSSTINLRTNPKKRVHFDEVNDTETSRWNKTENQLLQSLVKDGITNPEKLQTYFPTRTAKSIRSKVQRIQKTSSKDVLNPQGEF
jgi:hypothetical protein